MFIVCPQTLLNSGALETRSVPKRMLGRIAVIPRTGVGIGLAVRMVFEVQFLRFFLPLLPFVFAMMTWPELALPISQAPLPMFIAIAAFEMKVLAVKKDARPKLIDDAEMARGLDAFRFNATRLLTRIAAKRGLTEGEILLVVEQSELARIPPLTLVSLQRAEPEPEVMALDEAERALIAAELFDEEATERRLHLISLREGETLRAVTLDAASVTAHARMAALMADAAPQPPAET